MFDPVGNHDLGAVGQICSIWFGFLLVVPEESLLHNRPDTQTMMLIVSDLLVSQCLGKCQTQFIMILYLQTTAIVSLL